MNYERYESEAELRKRLGNISQSTLYRLRRHDGFPDPVRLSPGRVGYAVSRTEAWERRKATAGAAA